MGKYAAEWIENENLVVANVNVNSLLTSHISYAFSAHVSLREG